MKNASELALCYGRPAPGEVRRAGYVYDNPGLAFDPKERLTKQEFAAECDVNNILARAQRDGFVEHINHAAPQWGVDVSQVVDFQSALNLVNEAQASFMQLPGKVRARFDNDPGKFLAWVDQPGNKEEARLLGLLDPVATPPATPAEQAPQGPLAAPAGAALGLGGSPPQGG